jgi:isopenicillin N synthase-like dioxygenase
MSGSSSPSVNANTGFVPVIDISRFLNGDAAQKSQVAAQVDAACREAGFYVIVGHGVEQSLLDRTEVISRAFFALPVAEKMRLHRDLTGEVGSAGYTAIGDNNLSYTRGENLPFDLNETIQIAPIDVGDDDYYREGASRGMFPPNRWPESLPEFEEVYVEYFRRITKLAGDLMRLSALALDLPENYFVDKIDRPVSKLAARLYPEQTEAPLPGQLRAAAHTDYGTVTILKPGDAPGGLQVADRDGAWHDVPYVPSSFVINLGDIMARWTNDRWRSTLHRVVNPPPELREKSRRLSIVFFGHPNYDVTVSCLPTCQSPDNPPRYPPITVAQYYLAKQNQARVARFPVPHSAAS